MDKCKSITQEGERCRNSHVPSSRYCWRHQDIKSWLMATLIGVVLGGFFDLGAVLYQERSPSLETLFHMGEGGDPSTLVCIIRNSGRAEAKDVFLSFHNMLLLETKLLASSELGLTMLEAEAPPDPSEHPSEARLQKAFAVRIPRIAPKDTLSFQVITSNNDNRRAAKQRMRIREEEFRVLVAFIDRVSTTYPNEVKKWSKDEVINAHIKDGSFFTPAYLPYESGRIPVSILTDSERLAKAVNQDLYTKYKKEFIEVFQGGSVFKSPVIRVKTSQGESTVAMFPPYINTYIESSVAVDQLLKSKGELNVPIPVPKEY
jgi:hypothetical protein